MAHKLIFPQKKIMSRSFLNSGTLIVKMKNGTKLSWEGGGGGKHNLKKKKLKKCDLGRANKLKKEC